MVMYALEIEGPFVTCGKCRFISSLSGTFVVEEGKLTWTGDPYLTPRRGPDIGWCSECGTVLDRITLDGNEVSMEQFAEMDKAAGGDR